MDIDLATEPLDGDVYLHDIWPTAEEIADTIASAVQSEMFARTYANVFEGDDNWKGLKTPSGNLYEWVETSTYIRRPPYFEGMTHEPPGVDDLAGARCLVMVGDSVTTDH